MKIWIDIYHVPQFNFYVKMMKELVIQGHEVLLTVLDRGKTVTIVRSDLERIGILDKGVQVYTIGKHKMTKWSVLWDANIFRLVELGNWRRKHNVGVCFTNGFQAALWSKLYGNSCYTFGDDPDTFDYYPKLWFATKVHFCLVDRQFINGIARPLPLKVIVTKCLKEWAYLNPRTFVPNERALEKYGVKPKEYMFLREVSVGTINYAGQESGAILDIKDLIPSGMKVLFSLEEKKRREEYPSDWILLQEPIEDIHSLIYYSAGLVSSGDSMAREAALLGVPSYYLGIRYSMPANAAASKVASLQNQRTMGFEAWVREYITKNTESTVADSNLQDLASQSACEQAHRQLDNQVPATDADAHHLSDSSQKNVICDNSQKNVSSDDTSKNGHAGENVIEQRMRQQQELRARIDAEFIDINEYMLRLVEGVKE